MLVLDAQIYSQSREIHLWRAHSAVCEISMSDTSDSPDVQRAFPRAARTCRWQTDSYLIGGVCV